jgi:hypothetical protein
VKTDESIVRLKLKAMRLQRPRQWGACWLALDLDVFWAERLPVSRKGTPLDGLQGSGPRHTQPEPELELLLERLRLTLPAQPPPKPSPLATRAGAHAPALNQAASVAVLSPQSADSIADAEVAMASQSTAITAAPAQTARLCCQ